MIIDPYKNLVLIEWTDAASHEDKWTNIDEAVETCGDPIDIVTVGILLKKSETHYILARSLDLQVPQDVDGVFQIPIDVVKTVTKLNLGVKKKL